LPFFLIFIINKKLNKKIKIHLQFTSTPEEEESLIFNGIKAGNSPLGSSHLELIKLEKEENWKKNYLCTNHTLHTNTALSILLSFPGGHARNIFIAFFPYFYYQPNRRRRKFDFHRKGKLGIRN
jgi:hypothetical protein